MLKYKDFLTHLKTITDEDKKFPTVDKLKVLYFECVYYLLDEAELKDLINDEISEIPTQFDIGDDEIMPLNILLVYALSYLIASRISKNNKEEFQKTYYDYLAKYRRLQN